MKHIRTTWAEPVYTIEITEAERQWLANILAYQNSMLGRELDHFFGSELPATKP